MISAAELRKFQAEYNSERFINACNKYHNIIINECKLAIEHIQNNNITNIILNTNRLIQQTDGYSYTTMLYGFWNKHTSTFNNDVFREYGILSPLEKVIRELDTFGYKLEDISINKHLLIKLSF
jgi:hypothetical protein